MDFEYTTSQKAFRAEFRTWLKENLPDGWLDGKWDIPDDPDEADEFLRDWQQTLYEGGWAGISWPEEYGGRGATLMEQVIYNQELSRANAPLLINRVGLLFVGPTLIEIGTEEQKERFLSPMLRGEEIWCQGFSEPNAGSDLSSLQTKAKEEEEGHFVINGQKIWTSHAQSADWCFLLTRTDTTGNKHEGITALLVPMDQDEITIEPIHQITDDHHFNQVYFDDAKTESKHVVGEKNDGWSVTRTLLSFEHGNSRLYQPDKQSLEKRLEDLVEFCQSHTYQGKPLSQHQPIRQRLAQLHSKLLAADLTHLRYVHEQMESGKSGPKGSMDKIFSSEVYREIESFAMEIQGANAGLWEDSPYGSHWAERYLDTYGSTISGGTVDIHRNIVAERILGLPRDIPK